MLRAYSDETGFHGPKLVASSTTRFDAALWIAIALACVAGLVYDVSHICIDYIEQAPAVSLELNQSSTIRLEDAILCRDLDRDLFSLRLQMFANESDALSEFRRMLTTPNGTADACTIDDILRMTRQTFNVKASDKANFNRSVVFQAAYTLLARYMDVDLGNVHAPTHIYTNEVRLLLDELKACFLRRNVSFVALVEAVAQEMAHRLTSDELAPAWIGPSLLPRASGRDLVCVRLGTLQLPTNVSYKEFELYKDCVDVFRVLTMLGHTMFEIFFANSTMIDGWQFDRQGSMFEAGLMRLDADGGEGVMTSTRVDKAIAFFPILTNYILHVGVEITVRRYSRRAEPCADESRFECATRCKIRGMLDARGCWPLSFFAMANKTLVAADRPPCMETPQSLMKGRNVSDEWEACWSSCPPPCIETLYSGKASMQDEATSLELGTFHVTPKTTPYPVLSESPKMGHLEFLAAIGGSAGLWLGGSFISIFHMIVFPLQQWLVSKYNRQQKASNAPAPATGVRCCSTVHSKLVDFCSKSPLHGVPFVGADDGCRWRNAFWLLVVAVATAVAVQMTLPLYAQYAAEPTTFRASIVRTGQPLRLGNLSLCVQSILKLETRANTFAPKPLINAILSEVVEYFSESKALDSLARGAYPDATLLMQGGFRKSLLNLLLHIVIYTDMNCSFDGPSHGDSENGTLKGINVRLLDAKLVSLRQVLLDRGVDFRHVHNVLSVAYCLDMIEALTFRTFDESTGRFTQLILNGSDVCTPESVRWLSDCGDTMCTRLGGGLQVMNILWSKLSLRLSEMWWVHWVGLRDVLPQVFVDARGGASMGDERVSFDFQANMYSSFTVNAEFDLLSRASKPCSPTDGEDHYACMRRCYANTLRVRRNCTPLAEAGADGGESVFRGCNQSISLLTPQPANKRLSALSVWTECDGRCSASCRVQNLFITNANQRRANDSEHGRLDVSTRRVPFLRMEEELAFGWKELVSGFGGTIGLWFGASVLALLHVPFYLLFGRVTNDSRSTTADRLEIRDQTIAELDSNRSNNALREPAAASGHERNAVCDPAAILDERSDGGSSDRRLSFAGTIMTASRRASPSSVLSSCSRVVTAQHDSSRSKRSTLDESIEAPRSVSQWMPDAPSENRAAIGEECGERAAAKEYLQLRPESSARACSTSTQCTPEVAARATNEKSSKGLQTVDSGVNCTTMFKPKVRRKNVEESAGIELVEFADIYD